MLLVSVYTGNLDLIPPHPFGRDPIRIPNPQPSMHYIRGWPAAGCWLEWSTLISRSIVIQNDDLDDERSVCDACVLYIHIEWYTCVHSWLQSAVQKTTQIQFTFSLCWPQLIDPFASLTKLKKQQTDQSLQFTGVISTYFIAWMDRPEMAGSMFRCVCIALCFLVACNLEDAIAPIYLPADGEPSIEMIHATPLLTAGHGMNKLDPFYRSYRFPSMW